MAVWQSNFQHHETFVDELKTLASSRYSSEAWPLLEQRTTQITSRLPMQLLNRIRGDQVKFERSNGSKGDLEACFDCELWHRLKRSDFMLTIYSFMVLIGLCLGSKSRHKTHGFLQPPRSSLVEKIMLWTWAWNSAYLCTEIANLNFRLNPAIKPVIKADPSARVTQRQEERCCYRLKIDLFSKRFQRDPRSSIA